MSSEEVHGVELSEITVCLSPFVLATPGHISELASRSPVQIIDFCPSSGDQAGLLSSSAKAAVSASAGHDSTWATVSGATTRGPNCGLSPVTAPDRAGQFTALNRRAEPMRLVHWAQSPSLAGLCVGPRRPRSARHRQPGVCQGAWCASDWYPFRPFGRRSARSAGTDSFETPNSTILRSAPGIVTGTGRPPGALPLSPSFAQELLAPCWARPRRQYLST